MLWGVSAWSSFNLMQIGDPLLQFSPFIGARYREDGSDGYSVKKTDSFMH